MDVYRTPIYRYYMKNEAGKIFGQLTVSNEYKSHGIKVKHILWKCKCSCGSEKWIKASNLRAGRAISCGCARYQHPNFGQKPVPKDSKYFFQSWVNIWRRKAETRHRDFTITIDDLDLLYEKQNGRCFYSGDPLIVANGSKFCLNESNISLDRIDNSKGYTLNNIVLCTKTVNISRNTQSIEDYISLCDRISKYQKEKGVTSTP